MLFRFPHFEDLVFLTKVHQCIENDITTMQTTKCAKVQSTAIKLTTKTGHMCKFSVCCDQREARLSHPMYLCVCVCVKGVGDVASSCRGDRGDACLKAWPTPTTHRHTLPPLLLKHPHFLPILFSFPLSFILRDTLFHMHAHTRAHSGH